MENDPKTERPGDEPDPGMLEFILSGSERPDDPVREGELDADDEAEGPPADDPLRA